MLIDLHVHTRHTPGCSLSPAEVVRRAREAGLDGIVVTDMGNLDGLAEVREAGRAEGIVALCGVEVATDRGHYLAYFPEPEKLPALPQFLGTPPWPVQETLARVAERGGVVVAAHPYDKSIERPGGDVLFTLEGLAAVEGLDGRRSSHVNDLAIEAADHLGLPCVGGSGARGSLQELGSVATLFRDPVRTEADLVAQLRSGSVWCVAIGATPARSAPGHERDGWERDGRERGGRHDRGERRHDRDGRRHDRDGRSRGGRGGGERGGGDHGGGRHRR